MSISFLQKPSIKSFKAVIIWMFIIFIIDTVIYFITIFFGADWAYSDTIEISFGVSLIMIPFFIAIYTGTRAYYILRDYEKSIKKASLVFNVTFIIFSMIMLGTFFIIFFYWGLILFVLLVLIIIYFVFKGLMKLHFNILRKFIENNSNP